MRSKNIMVALIATAFVMIAVGCGGGNKLAGKWNVTGLNNMPPGASTTMNFESGDKMTMEMSLPIGTGKINVTVSGTYAVAGDTLTIKGTDAKFDFPGMDEATKKQMTATMEGTKSKMLEDMSKGSGKLKWDGNDKVTVTGTDGGATLTRAK